MAEGGGLQSSFLSAETRELGLIFFDFVHDFKM